MLTNLLTLANLKNTFDSVYSEAFVATVVFIEHSRAFKMLYISFRLGTHHSTAIAAMILRPQSASSFKKF